MTRSRMVLIQRAAVIDAESAINAMVERLRSPERSQPKGSH